MGASSSEPEGLALGVLFLALDLVTLALAAFGLLLDEPKKDFILGCLGDSVLLLWVIVVIIRWLA